MVGPILLPRVERAMIWGSCGIATARFDEASELPSLASPCNSNPSFADLGVFQRYVVLLAVASLMPQQLEEQVGFRASGNGCRELNGTVVVQYGFEPTLKQNMPVEGASDFQFDRLARVVAHPLAVDLVI